MVKEEIVPAETIQKGDIIRVLAGEDIPSDGVIISGETSINQAIVTGNPFPLINKKGDSVFREPQIAMALLMLKLQKNIKIQPFKN